MRELRKRSTNYIEWWIHAKKTLLLHFEKQIKKYDIFIQENFQFYNNMVQTFTFELTLSSKYLIEGRCLSNSHVVLRWSSPQLSRYQYAIAQPKNKIEVDLF